MSFLTKKQVKQLKKNADLVTKEAKFIQDGWVATPETKAFTLKTDKQFFNAMSEVINAVPEVFEQLSLPSIYACAYVIN